MNCRTPPMIHTPPPVRPRNPGLEREIMSMAARGAERLDDAGLSDYADVRSEPYGGVRTDQDWDRHGMEEVADLRNYLCWKILEVWDAYQAGDVEAGEIVARRLAQLSGLIEIWVGYAQR